MARKCLTGLMLLRDVAPRRCAESKEMREMASRICRDYLHGAWKQISSRDIVLKRISGGLSNWLYHVSLPGGEQAPRGSEPSQVLLRLYGEIHGGEQGVEGLITESVIFTLLSERRLGPRLHGIFPGGRIEEYIPARPLKTAELADPKLSPMIAEKMAEIHSMNVPISKEPNWLWDTANRWLQNVMVTLCDPAPHTNAQNAHIISRLTKLDLAAEVKWLKKFLVRVNSPVVFCHNDMQEGNILLVKECSPPRLVLIDFEYCSYNYRAFDLANHFIEWTIDYTIEEFPHFKATPSAYPTPDQQLAFVRAYLQTARRQREHNCGGTVDALPPGQHPTEEEAALLKEVREFTLATHLLWGLWSIVNATVSQIPFGYWEYAEERLNSYLEAKASFTSSSDSVGVKRKTEDID
ncbi:choline/ethanolamine kinase isoform X2 [Frankliniella occidentalis]|uniref:Choline/ethanolamine kinase isoform X2 n=1 Tax=Frankliniella occidentalis TaxID=133901 RepID=A0A6J1S8U5_FRAOC|nr:choline/ethanolamine kinase isoform X2 [Frankliniella occidentalis]